MSWSVSAVGKKAAVLASIDKQFAAIQCKLPEQALAIKAGALVHDLIVAADDNFVLRVDASGSAGCVPVYEEGSTTKVIDWRQTSQTLKISVEPVWGFLDEPVVAPV